MEFPVTLRNLTATLNTVFVTIQSFSRSNEHSLRVECSIKNLEMNLFIYLYTPFIEYRSQYHILTVFIRWYIYRCRLGTITFYGKRENPYSIEGKLLKTVDFFHIDSWWDSYLSVRCERFVRLSIKHSIPSQYTVHETGGNWVPRDSQRCWADIVSSEVLRRTAGNCVKTKSQTFA